MAWNDGRADFDRNFAVVIGIDRYENPSIRNLRTAVSDASAIADLLEQEYAYKQSDEKPEVIRLFDEAATLKGLRDLLTQTLPEQKLTEGDRLVVYFAGHGLPRSNEDGPEGYLVPHDADPTEPTSFLSMREVSDALSKLECHHLLVILDCCFAGTFRWAGSRKAVPILETIRREHYYHFIRHPAWQVITSSAHDQEALDVARLKEDNRQPVPGLHQPHSPFALALLEGLQPGNDPQRVKADLYPDGVVTAHELFVYLQSRVKELSGEQQAPGIYPLRRDYDKGEFIFTPPGFDPQKLAEALPLNEENNPYRGLKSFDEKHARFFFGRQTLIENLAVRLAKPEQALTVVLGVSGSGKSSLVKAGLMPYLRNQQTEQNTDQWRMLDPMRPGVSPFTSLARTLLPIVHDRLLEQLAQVSFLDSIFQPMLKTKAASEKDSEPVALMKVADSWCSATPEAKLLLIEDYFAQLGTLGNSQQQEQLKSLHDRILAEVDAVSHHLQQEPQFFNRAIATWSQKHLGVHLLLVIDQFEELLTRSQDDSAQRIPDGNRESPRQTEQKKDDSTEQKEWQKFLEGLSIAIAEHPQTLRLVLTLRSDFEPRFLSSALEPYWKDARFPVRAMTPDELRQAIENPALKQALYFEEAKDGNLVSKLVDEVGQMPGALPLLSFTLSELYVSLYKRWQDDRSTDRTLRFAEYKALGGVAGALTRRATKEYEALDATHQATMQRVMLRMVTIEGGGVARRRVQYPELVYSDPVENERVERVINQLVNTRLLVKGQEAGESYVEPAHDFLISGWDKLQKWIKAEQENITLLHRLNPAVSDWNNKRAAHFLWNKDYRLDTLNQLRFLKKEWFNYLEKEFIQNSIERRINIRAKTEFDQSLAIMIGINEYGNGIAPLHTAVNDVKELTRILQEDHGYQVELLLNQQATLANLVAVLKESLIEKTGPEDRLLFYFAGHGVAPNGDDVPEGYLLPQDARLGDPTTFLSMYWLNELLTALPCRHVLVILDCCFVGTFRWPNTRKLSPVEPVYKDRFNRFIQDPAWQVITSAGYNQTKWDNSTLKDNRGQKGNYSPFATAFIEAIQGKADVYPPAEASKPAGDGVITATELYLYLRDQVEPDTEPCATRYPPDNFILDKHDQGEYIFLSPGHPLNLPDAPLLDESSNPYRGLASFDEDHKDLFFGRQALTQTLTEFVSTHALTVVVGDSSSGKSSLIKAGLIPKLRQANEWTILPPIRPGDSPFKVLNQTMKSVSPLSSRAIATDSSIASTDDAAVSSLLTPAQSLTYWFQAHPQSHLLVVIDQLEELITLCREQQERQNFLEVLAEAIATHPTQLHLVLTLRSDFESQFRNTALEPDWQGARFVVPAMTRDELRQAIEAPASTRVMYFHPHKWIDRLIDEVANMPGALPLLSIALSELYLNYLKRQKDARDKGETLDLAMTQADYEAMGGMAAALTQRAERVYEELVQEDPDYEQTIRNVMLRMVSIGGGELALRRVPLSELDYPDAAENGRVKEVIKRFEEARLLTSHTDSGKPYKEPAHDALVRWSRLVDWTQKHLREVLLQRDLTSNANQWESNGKKKQDASLLWNSARRLPEIQQWLNSEYGSNWLNQTENEFIRFSLKQRFYDRCRKVASNAILIGLIIYILFIRVLGY